MVNVLERGRERYGRRAWAEAYRDLSGADQATALAADDLERLATAAYLTGRDLEFQRILERLYHVHVEAGERPRAARCAFWLGLTLLFRGEIGQANAWTARGERLIHDVDRVERGYLLVPVAAQQVREGHAQAGHATANEAVAIGERFGDADLTAAARHLQGRALIQQGEILAGLKRLDEAMLPVVAGELSPIMTGLLYCSVIDSCRDVYAFGRAREWTSALSRVCEQQPEMVAFTGTCLVHRAEILQFQGAWPDALIEAGRACERARLADRKPPGAALYRQAEIHRLCGEFEKAEDAYRSASELGCEPQPGLALLRMAQGRTDVAGAAIRRLTRATSDRVRRARLLPAHVDIMLAIGDVEDARAARDELRTLAQAFDTDVLRAVVAQADGAIALAAGDPHAALDPLRCAFDLWERLVAPYEAARVRVLIGHACRALGDEEAAGLEHQAAKSVFERLGARPDLALLDAPIPYVEPPSRHRLTTRELDVLRLVANGRTNKEIADTLCLSERTIDRHVSNILGKLDVPSRTAATAYAFHHKLL
jgi:DNA-binding CsgD family transcriptional regulator/tetratricopeptide (TPR) repeat protein